MKLLNELESDAQRSFDRYREPGGHMIAIPIALGLKAKMSKFQAREVGGRDHKANRSIRWGRLRQERGRHLQVIPS